MVPDEAAAHHVAELQRQGYSLRPEALSPDLCDEILAELELMDGTWGRSLGLGEGWAGRLGPG